MNKMYIEIELRIVMLFNFFEEVSWLYYVRIIIWDVVIDWLCMGLKENDLLYFFLVKIVFGNVIEVVDSVYILLFFIYENYFIKFLLKWEEYNIFDIYVMYGYYYLKNISIIFLRLKYLCK